MKKFSLLLMLAAITMVFTACPYSAEFPIDAPSIKVDKSLLGVWESRSSTDYEYTVTSSGDYVYSIKKKSKTSDDVTSYLAHVSMVGTTQYLNVAEESTTPTYYFYKLTNKGSVMVDMDPITENIDEKFTNSADFKKFIAANHTNSYFFDKEVDTYIKVK